MSKGSERFEDEEAREREEAVSEVLFSYAQTSLTEKPSPSARLLATSAAHSHPPAAGAPSSLETGLLETWIRNDEQGVSALLVAGFPDPEELSVTEGEA